LFQSEVPEPLDLTLNGDLTKEMPNSQVTNVEFCAVHSDVLIEVIVHNEPGVSSRGLFACRTAEYRVNERAMSPNEIDELTESTFDLMIYAFNRDWSSLVIETICRTAGNPFARGCLAALHHRLQQKPQSGSERAQPVQLHLRCPTATSCRHRPGAQLLLSAAWSIACVCSSAWRSTHRAFRIQPTYSRGLVGVFSRLVTHSVGACMRVVLSVAVLAGNLSLARVATVVPQRCAEVIGTACSDPASRSRFNVSTEQSSIYVLVLVLSVT
jgi:hypothetical protein